jgi:TPP-dependent indolepyruvate ferredoxin oxidoreductase alpha subunit
MEAVEIYFNHMNRNRKFHEMCEKASGRSEDINFLFNDQTLELSVFAHGEAALEIKEMLKKIGVKNETNKNNRVVKVRKNRANEIEN